MPVLFLAAEHDHLVPSVRQAAFMTTRVSGSIMRVLEGHGHICLITPDIDLEHILTGWQPYARRRASAKQEPRCAGTTAPMAP